MIKRVCGFAVVLLIAACSSDARSATGTTAAPDIASSTSVSNATTIAATLVATASTAAPPAPPGDDDDLAPATTLPEGAIGQPFAPEMRPTPWVAGAQDGDPEVSAAPGDCAPLFDAIAGGPYISQDCGIWNATGGQRMWTITKDSSGRFYAIIWQQNASNNWVPRIRALEPTAGLWSNFTIRTSNLDGGTYDEFVSGVRYEGIDILDISIVDIRSGDPRVMAVYDYISRASVVLRPGVGVEVWAAFHTGDDPDCCPSVYLRFTLFSVGGMWLKVLGPTVPLDDPSVPVSQF